MSYKNSCPETLSQGIACQRILLLKHQLSILFSILTLLLLALNASAQYSDVTTAAAVDDYPGTFGDFHGPGGVFTDLDNDGFPDLVLVTGAGDQTYLYHNQPGVAPGGRVFVRTPVHNTHAFGSTGAVAGDYDNDGDVDIYVINHPGPAGASNFAPNVLYQNRLIETGVLGFVDVTASTDPTPGIADEQHGLSHGEWQATILDNSLSAAWADVDRDGDLDLYVGQHDGWNNMPEESPKPGQRDILYRNNGDGTFTDITMGAGAPTFAGAVPGYLSSTGTFETATQNFSSTNAVMFSDLNGDGWQDLVVTNKVGGPTDADMLYLNLGNDPSGNWLGMEVATYDLAAPFGKITSFPMGLDIGDFDNDGDSDLYITDIVNPGQTDGKNDFFANHLWPSGALEMGFQPAQGLQAHFSWGAKWMDVNNDGRLDLHVATAPVAKDFLYVWDPSTGRFEDRASAFGVDQQQRARADLAADYDRDGHLDLFVINHPSGNLPKSVLYRNNAPASNGHHLTVQLTGRPDLPPAPFLSNRDAIGAKIFVTAQVEGPGSAATVQMREIVSGSGNAASTSSLAAHFGLGQAADADVVIWWPSGRFSRLGSVNVDQVLAVEETAGRSSFVGSGHSIPGEIEAEDYDIGGEGVTYHDTSAGNNGNTYRTDDVDLHFGGQNVAVAWTVAGEWLEYTVDVALAATYTVDLQVATPQGGRTVHLEVDGVDVTGAIGVPATGGWTTFQSLTLPAITLDRGHARTLRLVFDTGGVNLDRMTFQADAQRPYLGYPVTLPGTLEAEDYDFGREGIAYHDTNTINSGGKYRNDGVDISPYSGSWIVGWTVAGEWLEYEVSFNQSGAYDVDLEVATNSASATLHLELNGQDITGPIQLPNTGGFQTYQTVTVNGIAISAGLGVLRAVFDTGGNNLNRMSFRVPFQAPFLGTNFQAPGTLQMEDYDLGGEGISYHDTSPGNTPNNYYRTDDVDIAPHHNVFYVGWATAGEWLEYSLDVTATGFYEVRLTYATPLANQTVRYELDGTNITGSVALPSTGGWTTFQVLTIPNVYLQKGNDQILRFFYETGNANIDQTQLVGTALQLPFHGSPIQLPGTVQVEDYDLGGQGLAYHDTTVGNTPANYYRTDDVDIAPHHNFFYVGWTLAGEWLRYTVDVPTPGSYDLSLRYAAPQSGRTVRVELSGVDLTGSIALPVTGSWTDFQTLTVPNLSLPGGNGHVLTLVFETGWVNLDEMTFAP